MGESLILTVILYQVTKLYFQGHLVKELLLVKPTDNNIEEPTIIISLLENI